MSVVEAPETQMTEIEEAGITLLPSAVNKFRALLAERNLPDHALRVFVAGGGCSGMQYGMALEREGESGHRAGTRGESSSRAGGSRGANAGNQRLVIARFQPKVEQIIAPPFSRRELA